MAAEGDLVVRNGRVLCDSQWAEGVDVRIAGGLIDAIGPQLQPRGDDLDATGLLVVPGFVDVHVHGAGGVMCEDGEPSSVARISSTLAQCGVTGFLATIAALPPQALRDAVSSVASVIGRESGARILGLHLEGPYLNPQRAGAQLVAAMRAPSATELQSLQELSGGHLRLLTLAPELDGALPVIEAARRLGIVVSIGHTNATQRQARAAADAGATHVTHLFNAMRELHHREPGVVGVGLIDDRLSVELICDGHHLAPPIVELVLRCKPPGKTVFVSDAVAALGMPDGDYEMFGVRCVIGGGAVRLAGSGTLAGSCLSLDRAVRNVHEWLPHVPIERLIEAASAAPAAVIGAPGIGRIVTGARADLALLDTKFTVVATIAKGRIVWQSR